MREVVRGRFASAKNGVKFLVNKGCGLRLAGEAIE
jgi:hypothetical protein